MYRHPVFAHYYRETNKFMCIIFFLASDLGKIFLRRGTNISSIIIFLLRSCFFLFEMKRVGEWVGELGISEKEIAKRIFPQLTLMKLNLIIVHFVTHFLKDFEILNRFSLKLIYCLVGFCKKKAAFLYLEEKRGL